MFIFYRLHELGMRHILGVPGDFNLQLLDHIYKVPDLQWVGTCNELNAAYAADGYARIVGIGAFVTTFGVGELSAINGVAGAYSEQIPVIHVVGTTSRMMQKAQVMIHHTLSENWDHTTYQRMSEPVRSASAFLTDETTAAAEIDRVLETAVKTRLPVYLFVPVDVSDIIIDASPLMKPLNVEVHNVGREADEDKVVLEIIQLIEKASNPGIIVDMLVQRHGLVEDTKSLISLIDAPVSPPLLGFYVITSGVLSEASAYTRLYRSMSHLFLSLSLTSVIHISLDYTVGLCQAARKYGLVQRGTTLCSILGHSPHRRTRVVSPTTSPLRSQSSYIPATVQ